MVLGLSGEVAARDMFNPALLEINHPVDVDITSLIARTVCLPGTIRISIYVNGEYVTAGR
ncbi:hypothetical protein ACVXG7_01665 [Enterobacter hormaechei]